MFVINRFINCIINPYSALESRHMLYLQLRKSVLEKQILCTEDDLILLGGLALQAEVGDFQENVSKFSPFCLSLQFPK